MENMVKKIEVTCSGCGAVKDIEDLTDFFTVLKGAPYLCDPCYDARHASRAHIYSIKVPTCPNCADGSCADCLNSIYPQ